MFSRAEAVFNFKHMKRSDIPTIEVLKAYQKYDQNRYSESITEFPTEMLMKKYNCSEKLVYSAIQRDYNNGLIEFGISIRTGWLTDKGIDILRDNQGIIMQ